MKSVTENYILKHLKHAAQNITPDRAQELWNQPVKPAIGDEWYLDGINYKRCYTKKTIHVLVSLAACLAICLLSVYMTTFRVNATIYLDVNPSITLEVGYNETVLQAHANNPEGKTVLEGMDLKRTDLNTAVNTILGSMVKHGYLTETKDMVLLSVQSENCKKTDALRTQLAGEINTCLTSLLGSGAIFDQDVDIDDELETLAEKYHISPGKAALLRKITSSNPFLTYSDLAKMTINELTGYLTQSGSSMEKYTNFTGTYPVYENNLEPDNTDDPDDDDDNTDILLSEDPSSPGDSIEQPDCDLEDSAEEEDIYDPSDNDTDTSAHPQWDDDTEENSAEQSADDLEDDITELSEDDE